MAAPRPSFVSYDRQARIAVAAATMTRATAFLATGLSVGGHTPLAVTGPCRAKVLGNALRELDRFLNLLADAVAEKVVARADDRRALERLRNTANKLRIVRREMAVSSPDHERLRAIGRSRACLFYRGGRGDGGTGWFTRATLSADGVAELAIDVSDLEEVCRFYDRVAADLLALLADTQRLRLISAPHPSI